MQDYITFKQFRDDKRIITDNAEIIAFLSSDWICQELEEDCDIKAVYVYREAYYIEEWPSGFMVVIENTNPTGTLEELEEMLYDWAFNVYDHEIATIEDVKPFFVFLIKVKDLNFHPDTQFSDYVYMETDIPVFTKKEFADLENLLQSCRDVCELSMVDIYEIAIDAMAEAHPDFFE